MSFGYNIGFKKKDLKRYLRYYYRKFPEKFTEDILGIKLSFSQKLKVKLFKIFSKKQILQTLKKLFDITKNIFKRSN